MKIEQFDFNSDKMEDFINLQDAYYTDELHIKKFKDSLSQVLSSDNPFFSHAIYSFFILYEEEKPIGRLLAFIDKRRTQKEGMTVGNFGFFECPNNDLFSKALLDAAYSWLKKNGASHVHGPVDLNIYNSYRVMKEGFETVPFVGEPRNPKYYHKLYTQSGLLQEAYWRSWEIDSKEQNTFHNFLDRIITKRKNIHEVILTPINLDNISEELSSLYEVALEIFSQNYGYSKISKDEFIDIFKKLKPFLLPGSFQIATKPDGTQLGFIYGHIDFYRGFISAQGDSSKLLENLNYMPDRYVYHTFGVVEAMRYTDITARLTHCQTLLAKDKFPKSIAALTTQAKSIVDRIKTPNRSYIVMSKKL